VLLLTKDNKQNIYKGRILRRSMANLISKIIGIGLGLSLAGSLKKRLMNIKRDMLII